MQCLEQLGVPEEGSLGLLFEEVKPSHLQPLTKWSSALPNRHLPWNVIPTRYLLQAACAIRFCSYE